MVAHGRSNDENGTQSEHELRKISSSRLRLITRVGARTNDTIQFQLGLTSVILCSNASPILGSAETARRRIAELFDAHAEWFYTLSDGNTQALRRDELDINIAQNRLDPFLLD